MWWAVEDKFRCMNGVCDNDYFWDVVLATGLINSTSYGKEFCFWTGDKHSMVNCFDKRDIGLIDVHNWCSDVVFNTSISYDEGGWRGRVMENQIIKFLSMIVFFSFLFTKLKEKRSENLSDNRFPGVNSWWRRLKEGKIPYNLTLDQWCAPS